MKKLTILLSLILLTSFSCETSELESEGSNFIKKNRETQTSKRNTNNEWISLGQLQCISQSNVIENTSFSISSANILNIDSQNLLLNSSALGPNNTEHNIAISCNASDQNIGEIYLLLNEEWRVTQTAEDGGIIEVVLEQGHDRTFLRNKNGILELVLEQGQGRTVDDGILDTVLEQGHDRLILDGIEDFIIIETLEED